MNAHELAEEQTAQHEELAEEHAQPADEQAEEHAQPADEEGTPALSEEERAAACSALEGILLSACMAGELERAREVCPQWKAMGGGSFLSEEWQCAFFACCADSNVQMVTFMVENGVPVLSRHAEGLRAAIKGKNWPVVKYLHKECDLCPLRFARDLNCDMPQAEEDEAHESKSESKDERKDESKDETYSEWRRRVWVNKP